MTILDLATLELQHRFAAVRDSFWKEADSFGLANSKFHWKSRMNPLNFTSGGVCLGLVGIQTTPPLGDSMEAARTS